MHRRWNNIIEIESFDSIDHILLNKLDKCELDILDENGNSFQKLEVKQDELVSLLSRKCIFYGTKDFQNSTLVLKKDVEMTLSYKICM